MVAGGGLFPIATINLLSFKRIRDSNFKQFCNLIMKREINTYKKFPYYVMELANIDFGIF